MPNPAQSTLDLRGGISPVWAGMYATSPDKVFSHIGGAYRADYISAAEEKNLLARIDGADWLTDLKRRVQHYGYRYDYRARKIDRDMRIGDLPAWVMPLAKRLGEDFFGGRTPDQMIVNEYQPGQGIAPHVDCEPCFGAVVVSVSLASTCVMNFARRNKTFGVQDRVADGGDERIELLLHPRSVIVLDGESRYEWTHGIAPRKADEINGKKFPRARRVSLTFRTVIL